MTRLPWAAPLACIMAMGCDGAAETNTGAATAPEPDRAATRDRTRAPEAPFERACPDLPAERPADFVLRYAIHDNDRPENLRRYVVHLADGPCPPDEMPPHLLRTYEPEVCAALPAETLDALYADLARMGLDRVRTRPLPEWPHRAGADLTLAWGGHSCRVGDVSNDIEPAPQDVDAWRSADYAVRVAIRDALRRVEPD